MAMNMAEREGFRAGSVPASQKVHPSGGRGSLALVGKVHRRLMEEIFPGDLSQLDRTGMRREVMRVIGSVLSEEEVALPAQMREQIASEVIDEVTASMVCLRTRLNPR